MPRSNFIVGDIELIAYAVRHSWPPPPNMEQLRFYMYEEMGISAPTLYATMMTQEEADKMWKGTKTEYWPMPMLGTYVREKKKQ